MIDPATSFIDFMKEKVGGNWVVARRTPRIVRRYGDDVVCLSQRKYHDLKDDWFAATKFVPVN